MQDNSKDIKGTYQSLIVPELTWDPEKGTDFFGELSVQPLESGYGVTLGNTLRRVMLASIEGAAVTSVIIKGVNNEFSVLEGVVEDVLRIILNIKGLVIKNRTGLPGHMHLSKKGFGPVLASSITSDEHLSVINQDLVIANLSTNGEIEIDFWVEMGRGYRFAQWPNDVKLQPDDRIYIDSMFSPVTRVEYRVEKARVGQSIDYDRLIMGIHTNGSITPREVIHYAACVLRNQLAHFVNDKDIVFNKDSSSSGGGHEEGESVKAASGTKEGVPVDLFLKSVADLELSVRSHNCLVGAGIERITDLINLTVDDLLKIKNFGRKSLKEVSQVLEAFGLRLGMNVKEVDLKKAIKDKKGFIKIADSNLL